MAGAAVLDAKAMLLAAGVLPSMRVADFGVGRNGHLVFPAASTVGESGRVYAVDLVKQVLDMLEGRRRQYLVHNLDLVHGDIEAGNLAIPASSLDRVFVVNTLAVMTQHPAVAVEIKRLLKADGLAVVIEWLPGTRHPLAPSANFRLNPNDIDRTFVTGGYAVVGEFEPSQSHWGRIYKPTD